jgi:tRNA pseudouridine synthase 10
VRERWIEILEVEVPAEQNEEEPFLFVTMRTQAGTYVKEAISGEGGMTEPSVASQLGIDGARCLELDVLGILDEEGEESSEVIAEPSSPQSQSPFGAGL